MKLIHLSATLSISNLINKWSLTILSKLNLKVALRIKRKNYRNNKNKVHCFNSSNKNRSITIAKTKIKTIK